MVREGRIAEMAPEKPFLNFGAVKFSTRQTLAMTFIFGGLLSIAIVMSQVIVAGEFDFMHFAKLTVALIVLLFSIPLWEE